MKKYIVLCLVTLVVIAPLLALDGRVVSVSGKVEIQDARGTWRPLTAGEAVTAGAMISTGFKSEATIAMGASVLSIKPLTRMTLTQLTEKSDIIETELYLEVGNIRAEVNSTENKRNGFTVRSPVATASVRGTVFEMGEELHVVRGSVLYISAVGQKRIGNAGQQLALFGETVTGPMTTLQAAMDNIPISTLPSTEVTSPLRAGTGTNPIVPPGTTGSGTTTLYFIIE